MPELKKDTITEVIRYCNRDLVPDHSFNLDNKFPNEWFEEYFDFINDATLQKQLGDAFYQARFMYKLMSALRLPLYKQRGIVKFQIVQYASICEAVLDTAITSFFKNEAEERFSVVELKKENNAFSSDVKISRNSIPLFICRESKKKGVLKRTRVDYKTSFAVDNGLLTSELKDRLDVLYNLRNNVHIIKAADANYKPKLREAKDAFILMQEIVSYIKTYYINH